MPIDKPQAERQHEAVESLNTLISPSTGTICSPMTSITDAPAPISETVEGAKSSTVAQPQPRRLSNDSDVSILPLPPRPSHNIPLVNSHPPTPPPSEDVLILSGTTQHQPCISNIPYRLRPTEHDTHHAPHALDGPRHTSRCGIADNEQFAQHCSKYGQWIIDRAPDPHTTIKIGHGSGVSFRYFEAEFLDFPSVTAINIVHPLCVVQLRSFDWDVVRSVALHLRQYVGKRAVLTSSRNEAVQKAEELSLQIVEFELESRSWERRKAEDHGSDSDASGAASGSPTLNGPHTPLRYENKSFLSVTSLAPMATPPEHTGRPAFNTRRSNRRRTAELEIVPADKGEHTEGSSSKSHPDVNSYPPGTITHAAYDSDGTYVGQDPVHEQSARSLRSSKARPRVGEQAEDTLGVNYGCIGRNDWCW